MKAHRSALLQAFNPLSLSPTLMIDADNPAGNGSIPADNSTLSSWIDLSGNGNTFTAVSAATFKKNQMSGHNIVNFNGSSNYYTGPSHTYTSGTPLTIFIISGFQNTPPANSPIIISNGVVGAGGWAVGADISQSNKLQFTSFNIANYDSTSTWDTTGYDLFTVIYDGVTTLSVYKNGAGLDTQAISSPNTGTNAFYLGRYQGSGIAFWPGQINFLFVKYGTVTAAQLTLMHGWCKARLGI